jgi:hypothetical protein
MNFLRLLATDLRERHILPAVLLLVVLVIAIPVFAGFALSKSSTPPVIPTAPVSTNPPRGLPAPSSETLLAETPPTQHWTTYKGTERDPFTDPNGAASTATPTSSTPAAAPATTPATPSTTTKPSSPSSAKTHTSTTTTPKAAPKSLSADEAYSVNGQATYGGETDSLANIQRLAPLPANVPAMVYLGVVKGGKYAAFLLGSDDQIHGTDGVKLKCTPSANPCEVIEMSVGERLKLTLTGTNLSVSNFTFTLTSITALKLASASAAKGARESVSAEGALLASQSTATALANFVYEAKIGALVYRSTPATGTTGASGSSSATGATGATDESALHARLALAGFDGVAS